MTTFRDAFAQALTVHLNEQPFNNLDTVRYPPPPKTNFERRWEKLQETVDRWLVRAGYLKQADITPDGLTAILNQLDDLERAYTRFEDEDSRRWFVWLMVFRALGRHRVKLPTNTPAYWQQVAVVENVLITERGTRYIKGLDSYLDRYDLYSVGFPMVQHNYPLTVLCTYLLQQYNFQRGGRRISIQEGDVVLDCGGAFGDTAIYAAHLTGKDGRIFTFEFLPDNLEIMQANFALNTALAEQVTVVPNAVHDQSGEQLTFTALGPSSTLGTGTDTAQTVETITVDDFVKAQGLEQVDFIKMDIEGAELKALHGAQDTLDRYHPRLAIALYHKLEDFHTIPTFLQERGYQLFLDHFTIRETETILFAEAVTS